MNSIRREWREGKVRPIPGNSPHDRPVSRGISFTFWRICDDPFPATPFPPLQRTIPRRPVCVFKAWRNLSGPMWFQHQNQTLGWGRAASRWSVPSPGSRTCREDHAPSHRPQMSSGRLFLDRVARQQSPSPLHRHPQINMHSQGAQAKGDISTLPERRHFYFALTRWFGELDNKAIRRGVFRSVEDLEASINAFLTAWNQDPQPYVWTATVESITEKLSRCRRTLEKIQPGCTRPRSRKRKK